MSHKTSLQGNKHPKQDFQVERIAFFSDAVFAIAITLLVIEFHPPHVTKETTVGEIWAELAHMKYKLAALLISFALIVGYWMRHHVIFKHLHNYNRQIVLANMWSLLPMIFFPFTTSFMYESLAADEEVLAIPFRLFLLNNILSGISTYYLFYLTTRKYKQYSYTMEPEAKYDFEIKLLVMTISFVIVFLLSFVTLKYAAYGLIPLVIVNFHKRFFKKSNTKIANAK